MQATRKRAPEAAPVEGDSSDARGTRQLRSSDYDPSALSVSISLSSHPDRTLIVKHNKRVDDWKYETSTTLFKVSSTVLLHASPYFRALLNGPFRESSETDIQISCEDMDIDCFKLVLGIAHHRYEMLEQPLDFCDLVEVARVCDRFRMAAVVQHVAKAKYLCHSKRMLKGHLGKHLFVCWTFGLVREFRRVFWYLVWALKAKKVVIEDGEERTYWEAGGLELEECKYIPEAVLASLIAAREKLIIERLEKCENIMRSLQNSICLIPKHIICKEIRLGGCMSAFQEVGITPFATKPEQIIGSVEMLDKEIVEHIENFSDRLHACEQTGWCRSEFVELCDVPILPTRKEQNVDVWGDFFLQSVPEDLKQHFENVLKNR